MSNNPSNLAAVTPKAVDNGTDIASLLQPKNQPIIGAAATDPATTMALVNLIRLALIEIGACKAA